jgi:predicted nucleic acid-binding Zn ribbon protein
MIKLKKLDGHYNCDSCGNKLEVYYIQIIDDLSIYNEDMRIYLCDKCIAKLKEVLSDI